MCLMKYLMILTIGMCLLLTSVPAMADQAADEAAIREVVSQLFAALNKHDAKAYVALCAENFESGEGERKGHAAMEEYLSDVFANAKDIHFKLLDEIGILFVTPDVAIYRHYNERTGTFDSDGSPQPPLKRFSARVFVKKNNNWLFATHFPRPIEE